MKILTNWKSLLVCLLLLTACNGSNKETDVTEGTASQPEPEAFRWDAANIYFLLTDRFLNGKPENDVNFERTGQTAKLRGMMGGDIAGITQKIREGYFDDLGINAIWFTPVFEQIRGGVDEGTGMTYPFHGYWPRDWTALDPNFGTFEELQELVAVAHEHRIRILLDVILNHIGPVTEKDPVWPEDWVRTTPQCVYKDYGTTIPCTLVENLPDVKTESEEAVELPAFLVEKWKQEGRYEKEVAELNKFFERTGYPRAPKYYITKWLADYVRKLGVDGFRFDTVKHVEEMIFNTIKKESSMAFDNWKKENPAKVLDDTPFFMVGEVYGYGIDGKNFYDFGDKKVDYYKNGFNSLINFQFIHNSKDMSYNQLFSVYDSLLDLPEMKGSSVLNYLSSHDDGGPFDPTREKPMEAANKLLLAPGASQVYYGDELSRSLAIEGAEGDAVLRSFMNWGDLETNPTINGFAVKDVLAHWQKLGQFRKRHIAVGAGVHKELQASPFIFSRVIEQDKVVVGLDQPKGLKSIKVASVFDEGSMVKDAYSGKESSVKNGSVELDTEFSVVLLEQK